MHGAREFLRLVRPSDWPEAYERSRKLADDISRQEWPERCRRLSDELGKLVHERFGPRGVIAIVDGRKSAAGTPSRSEIEEIVLSGKALLTAALLQMAARGEAGIGVPATVEHALTLSLTLVSTWGQAAQALLERRDQECDDVLTTLPGYMLMMLADDFEVVTTRGDRVRAIWMRGLSDLVRTGPFSLTIH